MTATLDRHYHMDASLRCNNRCVFCLEGSHSGEGLERNRTTFGRDFLTPEEFREVLRRFQDLSAPLLFAGGEPTMNPHLPELVAAAHRAGFRRIGLQTNGRMLSYPGYLLKLVGAGLRRVGISLHGTCALIHDRQTRVPGSFRQSVTGLENCLALKRRISLEVSTHTTLNQRNLSDAADLLRWLFAFDGLDRIVVNPVIYEGEAAANAPRLAVSYAEMARELRRALAALRAAGAPRLERLVLVDFPACAGRGLEPFLGPFDQVLTVAPGPEHRELTTGLATLFPWRKREACRSCLRDPSCPGIHPVYLERFGWKAFVPVRSA